MEHQDLISELYQCAAACNNCYEACLQEEDVAKLERCMKLDKECYEVCHLTAHTLERGSEHADLFLDLCIRICNDCAEECEKHAHHEHCRKCAEACRKCVQKCDAERSQGRPEIIEVI